MKIHWEPNKINIPKWLAERCLAKSSYAIDTLHSQLKFLRDKHNANHHWVENLLMGLQKWLPQPKENSNLKKKWSFRFLFLSIDSTFIPNDKNTSKYLPEKLDYTCSDVYHLYKFTRYTPTPLGSPQNTTSWSNLSVNYYFFTFQS